MVLPGCARPVSGRTGSCAQGCWKRRWAVAGKGRAELSRGRAVREVAREVGTVTCVRVW